MSEEKNNYDLSVNGIHEFELNTKDLETLDVVSQADGSYHLLNDKQSYTIKIQSVDLNNKLVKLEVNGGYFEVKINDHYDRLIKKMGLAAGASKKINAINAPMPGLVLDVLVKNKQKVSKGDPLLILEAMKMENILKAPNDAVIKEIHIKKGNSVDKGTLLISLD